MTKIVSNFNITARWTEKLGRKFCPVSSFFLANYHRLEPFAGGKPVSSSEAMVLIHILDHKWTDQAPFPAVGTLARRMGITPRAVRNLLKSLEGRGYLRREYRANGKTTLYHLQGLYEALEALLGAEQEQAATADDAAGAAA